MRDREPTEPDPIADRDEGEMLRAAADAHAAARALVEAEDYAPIIDLESPQPYRKGMHIEAYRREESERKWRL